jgi:CHRD domain-containing protein
MCPMHRTIVLFAIATCLLLPACGSNGTAPSSAPAIFSAQLFPANEVPAVSGTESTGHGAVQVQFDLTRDANGAITAATATFYFQLTGYPDGTTIIGAHIHPAPAGVNGPVIISTGLTATQTVTVTNGTADFSFSGIPVDPALAQQIINNPSAYYFNVHSPANPGGFSRGQLTRVQ